MMGPAHHHCGSGVPGFPGLPERIFRGEEVALPGGVRFWLGMAAGTTFGAVTDLRERSIADEWRWRARRAASALVKGR